MQVFIKDNKVMKIGNSAIVKLPVLPSAFIVATGGNITIDGTSMVHTFTADGTFEVTEGSGDTEILVVGGGGAGGYFLGGGGGGGGVLYTNPYAVTVGSYNIVVGAGGIPLMDSNLPGANGDNSSFDLLSVFGGGGGGSANGLEIANRGQDGGSGGGTGYANIIVGHGTIGQGNDGGLNNINGASGNNLGGGGGGASLAIKGGNGGDGGLYTITGFPSYYGGGGGGYSGYGQGIGEGGAGGGGDGHEQYVAFATSGLPNTGGGGGGSWSTNLPGGGGSGIVIVRYQWC